MKPSAAMHLGLLTLAIGMAPSMAIPSDDARDQRKALIAAFNDDFRGNDSDRLVLAIARLSDGSRQLEDRGADKTITRLLAKGTREESLEVQRAAVVALEWGRHIGTVLDTCEELLEELHSQIERRTTRPDAESRTYTRDAVTVFGRTCEVLARHPDDRSVDILRARLRMLRKDSQSEHTSALLMGPLAEALLRLRSHDAVYAVVKQTQTFAGSWNAQKAGHVLHRELSQLALALDQQPPLFSDEFDVSWGNWFREHEDLFPKSLGKLKTPTESPADPLRSRRDRQPFGEGPDGVGDQPPGP